MKQKGMFAKEYAWRGLSTIGGVFVIGLTLVIGAFLAYKGSGTFLIFKHTLSEFIGSTNWGPVDNSSGGGTVGALIFICGSLATCGLALLIATPLSLGSAIFMTEISPKFGEKFFRPVVQIFAAGLVLAVMIFPTITSMASDAIAAVPKTNRDGAYGLGSTRWQAIYRVIVPAAKSGIISSIIMGLARAFGEALAVAMVIGQTTAMPHGLLSRSKTITTEIAAQMGNAMEGGELKTALWTLALLLFLISLLFIWIIHRINKEAKD